MNCSSAAREHEALLKLEGTVVFLEFCLLRFRKMIKDDGPWPTYYLPMFARNAEDVDDNNVQYTVLWGTWEGTAFKVEESTDGVRWYPAADIVEATAGEVFTSWVSSEYGADEQIYFRATLLRPSLVCCALPDEGPLPRFFETLLGPTGGSRYGGCTDCFGEFPICDDDLTQLI